MEARASKATAAARQFRPRPRVVKTAGYFTAESFLVLFFLTASLLVLPLILPPLPPPPLLLLLVPVAMLLVLLALAFVPSDLRHLASHHLEDSLLLLIFPAQIIPSLS